MVASLIFLLLIIVTTCEEIMYWQETKYKFWKFGIYEHATIIPVSHGNVKKKSRQRKAAALGSLFTEGFTVGALVHGGIQLVGTHQNAVQGAIVLVFAMMRALLDGTLDALIGMTVHLASSFDLDSGIVWRVRKKIYGKGPAKIAFFSVIWYFMDINVF